MAGRTRRKARPKQVALMMEGVGYSFSRQQIESIIEYCRRHADWRILTGERLQPFVSIDELRGWDGDGIIAQAYSEDEIEGLQALGIPVVNTSSYRLANCFHTVSGDNVAIGAMAARHLMERKLDRFAFVGELDVEPDDSRLEGFRKTLESQGATCEVLLYSMKRDRGRLTDSEHPSIHVEALNALEFPVGIMASADRTAFAVLEACRRLGKRCPEDVMLIGVDNDAVYCSLPPTSITSIDPAAGQIGYQAAEMLDRIMNARTMENEHVLIPPAGVVERHSTEMTRHRYPEVARALRFIRRHEADCINAADVVAAVPVSRRWLEMKFKEELGHGIYHEIRRVHIERAKTLLMEADWSVSRISRECGFNSAARFGLTFHEFTGTTAAEYRKAHTGHGLRPEK